jgi:hypothetical protein
VAGLAVNLTTGHGEWLLRETPLSPINQTLPALADVFTLGLEHLVINGSLDLLVAGDCMRRHRNNIGGAVDGRELNPITLCFLSATILHFIIK